MPTRRETSSCAALEFFRIQGSSAVLSACFPYIRSVLRLMIRARFDIPSTISNTKGKVKLNLSVLLNACGCDIPGRGPRVCDFLRGRVSRVFLMLLLPYLINPYCSGPLVSFKQMTMARNANQAKYSYCPSLSSYTVNMHHARFLKKESHWPDPINRTCFILAWSRSCNSRDSHRQSAS